MPVSRVSYRLYSSAHFNDNFVEHTPPEVLNTALEGVVLLMKAMGVDKVCKSGLSGVICMLPPVKLCVWALWGQHLAR